jgi:hypothetical protein
MPDALIVADEGKTPDILKSLVYKGLIKCVKVGGVNVYGRYYLTARAIRIAYNRKARRRELQKSLIRRP